MIKLKRLLLPALAVTLLGGVITPSANAKTTVHQGAPKALRGTWITKMKELKKTLRVKDSLYQRSIWYVGSKSTDESGLFYKTKTKPASMFNAEGGSGVNSGLNYTKQGNTYYLNSKGGKNYFHYKAKLVNNHKIKLYFSSEKKATKWQYMDEYYKQSDKLVHFTTKTKIKY
ncbi:hypothetical protein [Lactobacillus sp. Sy-1]|uniref:hypothetical protein n=1 Tax=Lactobacillus sp. Sy-1 TaxID=2109645 RepID=UPI001C5A9666|nr:hypothetical protein [Lactobacillus sp. Sy-1]MBW1606200.1 hypothetical protein [Lactobacillus sp. Sy-1]